MGLGGQGGRDITGHGISAQLRQQHGLTHRCCWCCCRCVLRQRSLASLADVLLFYAACQASAIVGLQLLQPAGSLKAGVSSCVLSCCLPVESGGG